MKGKSLFMTTIASLQFLAVGAQAVLTADGPGNTYERINNVLAPGYDVVENPECVHGSFGRHIAEVFDTDINQYAFEFYAHVNQDNDRCINFDRQRIEIKTYDQSPDSLIGTTSEFITYKWRFKIPVGFQPSSSFTHIHQIKPVNGDDDQPLFTLTARKGNPNKLELIYVATGSSGSNKVRIVNLSLFEGVWVEATEQILVGANGSYSMDIRRLSDNVSILSYSNNNVATIRPDNDFIRPKWGIYRSLNTPSDLRDESIRFSMFSIKEGFSTLPVKLKSFAVVEQNTVVKLNWEVAEANELKGFVVERSVDGRTFNALAEILPQQHSRHYNFSDNNPVEGLNYYRLRIKEDGVSDKFSPIQTVKLSSGKSNSLVILPNPVKDQIDFRFYKNIPSSQIIELTITGSDGRIYHSQKGSVQATRSSLNQSLPSFKPGNYFIHILLNGKRYSSPFIKL